MGRIVGIIYEKPQSDAAAYPYECPHCGKVYKTAVSLAKHIEKEHPEE